VNARHRQFIALSCAALTWPAFAIAQSSLRMSTGEVRTRGGTATSVLTVAPELSTSMVGLTVWSAGQFSLGNTGRSQSSFHSVIAPKRAVLLGLTPVVQVRGQDDPLISTQRNRRIDGAVGVKVGTAMLGASAGVGAARSVHGTFDRAIQTTNADVHFARGTFQFRVGYVGSAFDSPTAMSAGQTGFSLSRTRFSDITSNASWRFRGLELGGFMGRRLGTTPDNGARWNGGYASLALNDRIAVVARQETAPSDPTRHLAAQQLTSVGFRIRPSLTRARFDDGSDAAQFRREFVVSRLQGDGHGIRVYMPDAATVELAGSFNDWTPAPMRSAGSGWWELMVSLPTGIHTLNIRADGGKWQVPFGLDSTRDEFNGSVGVLNIP
jgi:hypothetical protein